MYTPTRNELSALLEIIAKLGQADSARTSRRDISDDLLRLLEADYLASYTWNGDAGRFEDCVALNIAPAHLESYDRHFQHCDPISPRIRLQQRATIVSEVISQRELERTEFFNDFLIVAGLHHGMDMHLLGDDGEHVGDLRIWRSRGRPEFGPREVTLLETLRPHLIGTLRRLNELARERAQARDWKAVWMQHPHASFMMDGRGRETDRNPSAIRLMSQLSPQQKRELPALLRDARHKPASPDFWQEFVVTVSVPEHFETREDGGVYMVQLAPRKSAAPAAAELISLFGLTQREADVCALVMQGLTDKEISKSLAISFPTVRTHLTHSFAKFNVTNRAELIHRITMNAK